MPVSVKHLKDLFKKKKRASKTVLLAKWPEDRKYYIVDPLKYNPKKDECYIEYEDKTETWAPRIDLHLQFCSSNSPYATDDDVVCCLCDGGISEELNEIVLCDVCQQGYHQQCVNPAIELQDRWVCQTCIYILGPSALEDSQDLSTSLKKFNMESSTEETLKQDVRDDAEQPIQQLENGTTVEKMQPAIINVAKTLVEKEDNQIGTNEFVQSLGPTGKNTDHDDLPLAAEMEESNQRDKEKVSQSKVRKTIAKVAMTKKSTVSTKAAATTKIVLPSQDGKGRKRGTPRAA